MTRENIQRLRVFICYVILIHVKHGRQHFITLDMFNSMNDLLNKNTSWQQLKRKMKIQIGLILHLNRVPFQKYNAIESFNNCCKMICSWFHCKTLTFNACAALKKSNE